MSGLAGLKHGIAVPNFATDPADLIELGVATEQAGFDGYFLWDHLVFSNTGDGPPIVDPWVVLSAVAVRTNKITIGTVVTPVPRRRPWQLARVTTTLDRLSNGRVVLGVGIGSPAYGDFGIFHEPTGDRERAELLDEGLDVLAGLWSGEPFSYSGKHLTVDTVRFTPPPVRVLPGAPVFPQERSSSKPTRERSSPRIPVWVAGELPAPKPIARAARWDGFVPIRYYRGGLARPDAEEIAEVLGQIATARGGTDGYDMVVWAEVVRAPGDLPDLARPYAEAGATWWIETARPEAGWWEGVQARVAAGPTAAGS